MNVFKLLAAGAAVGIILTAFRDEEGGGWIVPGRDLMGGGSADDMAEPVLGFDGMDEETLIDWVGEADLERETLLDMLRYEAATEGRQPVLSAIVDQL